MTNEDSDAHINWSLVLGHWSFVFRPFDAPPPLAYKYLGPESHCLAEALARGSREPGQALTGAAISGVLLCEGPCWAVGNSVTGSQAPPGNPLPARLPPRPPADEAEPRDSSVPGGAWDRVA